MVASDDLNAHGHLREASLHSPVSVPAANMHAPGRRQDHGGSGTSEGILLVGTLQEITYPKDLFPFGSFYVSNVRLVRKSELQIDKDLESNFQCIYVGIGLQSDI